jgi:hypothetical protein
MKKTSILKILFIILMLPKFASAVYINQVLYDPSGSESTTEAIELYNPASFDVDISGWIIATETSMKDAVIPANSILPAKGHYLIADQGWNSSKDSAWRTADHEEKITMNNDNSGIALTLSNGTFVDAVGWGSSAEIKNNLYEGSPASDVKEGKVLLRNQDTDDNSNDFTEAVPDFSDPNSIKITVNVTDSNNTSPVSGITIEDDDSGKEGIQINPVGGGKKRVKLVAVAPGGVTASFLGQPIEFNNTGNDTYEGYLELDCSLTPGNYTVNINQDQINFEYLSLLDLRVQANKVSFNALPGRETITSTPSIITNTGNVEFTLTFESNDLHNGDNSISSDNLKISTDNEDFYELGEGITIAPGEEIELYFSLFIPADTELGSYSTIITLIAEET